MQEFKASAIAHPIQGLIKYHGMKDEKLRLPFHDSISVCVAPFYTHTTIEFSSRFSEDMVQIDGRDVTGRERERVLDVANRVRQLAGITLCFRMKSINSFPSNVGLGASSSGFAALAQAAAEALKLDLSLEELSRIARLGAGSASRSVAGAFAYWKAGDSDETSYAYQIASAEAIPLGIIVVFIEAYKQTESAHKEAVTSPLYQARLSYIEGALKEMEQAIRDGNVERIGWLAEYDSLNLHAVTMTGEHAPIYWRPETIKVMLEVRQMRREGFPVFFSIDTGATVYVNTYQDLCKEVERRLQTLGLRTEVAGVGGPVRVTDEHLF